MTGKIFIASKGVGFEADPARHLYLVYAVDGNISNTSADNLRVIRGGQDYTGNHVSNLVVEVNPYLFQSQDLYGSGQTYYDRGTVELNIGSSNADQLWIDLCNTALALGSGGSFIFDQYPISGGIVRDTGLLYEATDFNDFTNNSNATIRSILAANNILYEENLPGGLLLPGEAPGQDTVYAGSHDDNLLIGSSVLYINGDTGNDTADFSKVNAAISVNLATGEYLHGLAGGEILNIENVKGTQYSDTITGDSNANIIDTGGGSGETVNAGDGNDTIKNASVYSGSFNGGNGNDTIDYSHYSDNSGLGVIVNITNPSSGWAGSLGYQNFGNATLVSIENVVGSAQRDDIDGNSASNVFDGNGGNDLIDGHGGADTLIWNSNYSGYVSLYDSDSNDTIQLVECSADDLIVTYFDSYAVNTDGTLVSDSYLKYVVYYNSIGGYIPIVVVDTDIAFLSGSQLDPYSVSTTISFRNPNGTLVSADDLVIGGTSIFSEDAIWGDDTDNTISGTANADVIYTADGNDTVTAGAGDDTLYSDKGNDVLNAGAGNDRVFAGKGNDIVSYVFQENISASDAYFGNQGEDELDLYFSSAELTSGVRSSLVSFRNFITNPSNIDEDAASGATYDFSVFDLQVSRFENFTLFVNNVATQITVDAKSDMFFGSVNTNITGNLLVDNGSGADTGFLDTIFANAGTFTTANGGTIVINANGTFTYTPPSGFSGIDSYTYTANDGQGTTGTAVAQFGVGLPGIVAGTSTAETLTGTSGNDTMYGLSGNDTLNGLDGNDVLDGGTGNDSLVGGLGDDSYYVDSTTDTITEAASAGTDIVRSTASAYTLSANIENLILLGSALSGTGNAIVNTITGNNGNNTLDGGAGADTLIGGLGDDTYIADATDIITENASEGSDTIQTAVTYTIAALANIENLTLTGSSNINGTGNSGSNIIIGNSGVNTLAGGDGNDHLDGGSSGDTMLGGLGDDEYVVNVGTDVITENSGEGNDTILSYITWTIAAMPNIENLALQGALAINATGNAGNNILLGNSAANIITGGAGDDSMAGGDGNDTYYVDTALDSVTEAASAGTDTVQSSITYILGANLENLTLTGTSNLNGTGNSDANTITGNAGNNTLDGGTGNDTMIGGGGDDIYIVDSASDVVTELSGGGTDIIKSYVTITTPGYVENITLLGTDNINASGGSLNNILTGNSGNNTLDGGAGTDTLIGGDGNDIYFVDSTDTVTENANEGYDTIWSTGTYTLAAWANIENLTLYGTSAINGTGNALDNVIIGNAANNALSGGDGHDVLDGGFGNDTLTGGNGNDLYVIDAAADAVNEGASAGTDTILTSITYALTHVSFANIENLILSGTSNLNGTGNGLDNVITGNSGDNALDGGTGNDTLIGKAGNDTYYIDSTSDIVTEAADEGTDIIRAAVTFTLSANVENLILTGSSAINGTGNILDNTITGNTGNNTLTGNGGNDTLDGGTGIDTLIGGQGNDIYIVDTTTDTITENTNEGTDTIQSSVTYSISALANIENLTLTGAGAIGGTGNAGNNVITGNSGNNTLDGGDGNDIIDGGLGNDAMTGGNGNDLYLINSNSDTINEAANAGIDTIKTVITWALTNVMFANIENLTLDGTAVINGTGNALDNIIIGNVSNNTLTGADGNDTLDGGAGNDALIGGLGDDVYYIDSTSDTITEAASAGTDIVYSTASAFTISANVENLILLGAALNGTGNTGANIITGTNGDNILDGGTGTDTLTGGQGNDTYVVDSTADVVTENANEGTDTIQSSVTYTIAALMNIENLTLIGSSAINGTGNSLNNIITGNSGVNTLYGGDGNDIIDGGGGIDTMYGGAGNDIYYVDNPSEVLSESLNEGTDLVYSSATSRTLDANLENITLIGTANIAATGNALNNIMLGNAGANTLTANDGNDTLDGGAGNDAMIGGLGDDIYFVDASDTVTEAASAGTDVVNSSVTFTLSTNVENLNLIGTGAINGTGNALANTITGNAANNRLDGGTDADTLIGGAGDDLYVIDNVSDTITENLSEGTDSVQSSVTYILAANVENLTLTGSSAIDGTGNSLSNTMVGNSGANTLDGGAGSDTMTGGLGNDIYVVDSVSDIVIEASGGGTDLVKSYITITTPGYVENVTLLGTANINASGGNLSNILTGNSGDNILDGNTAADTLIGGLGNDTYIADTSDTLTENASEGIDTVQIGATYTLLTNFENLTLTGTSAINGTGNSVDNVIKGNSGVNTLTGNDGNDTLYGYDGNDVLNGGNNNDTLYGGAGLDALTGGAGSDIFVFESASAFSNVDTISDFTTAQADKLNIHDLLIGYTSGVSDINDFVTATTVGGNTSILIDRDGAGVSYSDQAVATLTGVTGLTVDDLFNNGHIIT